MHKLNLFVLTLLFILSVAAAAVPRELKQAKLKRGEMEPRWDRNGRKPSKTPGQPTSTASDTYASTPIPSGTNASTYPTTTPSVDANAAYPPSPSSTTSNAPPPGY